MDIKKLENIRITSTGPNILLKTIDILTKEADNENCNDYTTLICHCLNQFRSNGYTLPLITLNDQNGRIQIQMQGCRYEM
jgi:hypothetical protein